MIETKKDNRSGGTSFGRLRYVRGGVHLDPRATKIELTIDSDTSVGIDACAELSRAIEAELDREEEDFSLTVMSAGIGSELRSLRQYRNSSRPAEVLLTNGVKILAKLDEATEEGITLSYEEKQAVEGKKKKQLVTSPAPTLSPRSNGRRSGWISNSTKLKNKITTQWTISISSATLPSSKS